jgi:hypothetical protein
VKKSDKQFRVWLHNSFLGHVAMSRKQMAQIMQADTVTLPARETAQQIDALLALLDQQLRAERFDG